MVTGAAGHTGFAIARALVEDGLRVLLADIDAMRLQKLCGQLGEAAVPLVLDVSDPDAVARVTGQTKI